MYVCTYVYTHMYIYTYHQCMQVYKVFCLSVFVIVFSYMNNLNSDIVIKI